MFEIIKIIFLGIVTLNIMFGIIILNIGENPKDKIVDTYDSFIQSFDMAGLTNSWKLKGERKYGTDKYVGTYKAIYDNYSGEETVFGGTALKRKNGDYIKIKIKIEKESGDISVVTKLGNNETILISDIGEYENKIYVNGSSYYLTIKLNNFRGNIDIIAE